MITTPTRNIRHRPAYQVNRLLRQAKVRQFDIAARLRCSQTMVSKAILRQVKPSALVERIWLEIERVVGDGAS